MKSVSVYLIGLGQRNNPRFYYPSTALNTLVGILNGLEGIELKVTDGSVDKVDTSFSGDLVGISIGHTPEVPKAYKIAETFRKKGVQVILGGLHPSYNPDEAKQFADSVFIGPSENNLVEVIEDARENRLKERYEGYGPFKIIPASKYTNEVNPRTAKLSLNTIISAVGCNNSCPWCTSKLPGMARIERPLDEFFDEVSSFEGQRINILDPNINQNKERFIELLKGLIQYKVKWYSELSATNLDEYVLDLMEKSGCRGVQIGFESLHMQNVLEVGKECYNVDNHSKVIRNLHDRKIPIRGSFVFGFDYDQPSVFRETVDFVVEHKIDAPLYAVLTPYPGTAFWKTINDQGRLLNENGRLITYPDTDFPEAWKLFDRFHVTFVPKNMTQDQLGAGRKWAKYESSTIKNTFKRLHDNPTIGVQEIIDNVARIIRVYQDSRITEGVKDYKRLIDI